jgi:deoxyadenosine/deoxycytidine kinase
MVYLYLSVEQLQANIRRRGREYEQKITDVYLEQIQHQYLEFIRQHKDRRIVIVDTTGLDFVNSDQDYLRMKEIISGSYAKGVTRIEALKTV